MDEYNVGHPPTSRGQKGLECDVYVHGIRFEHVSESKYLRCVLDESGTDEAVIGSWRVESGMQMPTGLMLMLEICSLSVLVLTESLPVPVLMYGSKIML